MSKFTAAIRKFFKKSQESAQKEAQEELLQELFHDMYRNRKRIYHLNFVRGIFFGVGSVIGGTLVIGLVIWILSLFVNFPLIGDYFRDIQQSIQRSKD